MSCEKSHSEGLASSILVAYGTQSNCQVFHCKVALCLSMAQEFSFISQMTSSCDLWLSVTYPCHLGTIKIALETSC